MHRKRALEQLDRDIRDHIDQDVADRIARGIARTKRAGRRSSPSATSR